jgi:hypothetical protein
LPVNYRSWERLPPSTLPVPTSSWAGDDVSISRFTFFYSIQIHMNKRLHPDHANW